jgi:hypothetical protein
LKEDDARRRLACSGWVNRSKHRRRSQSISTQNKPSSPGLRGDIDKSRNFCSRLAFEPSRIARKASAHIGTGIGYSSRSGISFISYNARAFFRSSCSNALDIRSISADFRTKQGKAFEFEQIQDAICYVGERGKKPILTAGSSTLEKEPLPLPVDFQSIDIILLGPFAGIRKYAQRTRSHPLMFARFSKSGNKWQRRRRCHLLPKTNRGLDQIQ